MGTRYGTLGAGALKSSVIAADVEFNQGRSRVWTDEMLKESVRTKLHTLYLSLLRMHDAMHRVQYDSDVSSHPA